MESQSPKLEKIPVDILSLGNFAPRKDSPAKWPAFLESYLLAVLEEVLELQVVSQKH